ncbi:unnamed protein product [Vitrella brassicaformis CCMP3155]|uniref:Endonuclease/exonuclease/phosphatase domain-containing protein n=1 Tax=Vitrella brassicaformis (strain CCMP3155) TaxID=1169540 RepID=A0A0G4EWM1_VITBC|nr:unnamed protein product [Vitrella brassicaformis CCMP3155]|eukprot:CEM02658.1 unnamed protein product [Vitrella brassicaformis CCMP3155]
MTFLASTLLLFLSLCRTSSLADAPWQLPLSDKCSSDQQPAIGLCSVTYNAGSESGKAATGGVTGDELFSALGTLLATCSADVDGEGAVIHLTLQENGEAGLGRWLHHWAKEHFYSLLIFDADAKAAKSSAAATPSFSGHYPAHWLVPRFIKNIHKVPIYLWGSLYVSEGQAEVPRVEAGLPDTRDGVVMAVLLEMDRFSLVKGDQVKAAELSFMQHDAGGPRKTALKTAAVNAFKTASGQGRTTATKEAVLAKIPIWWKTPTGARTSLQLCFGGAHLDSTASPTSRIKQASTIFKAFGGGTAEATEAEHLLACDVAIVNADFNPRGIPGNLQDSLPDTCFDRYFSMPWHPFSGSYILSNTYIRKPMFLTEILGQPDEGYVNLWTGNMTPIRAKYLEVDGAVEEAELR